MNSLEPQLKFAPNKPFYPLVCSYLAQTHGFIELISRGLLFELKQLQPTYIENLKIDQTNEYNSDTFTRLAHELLQKGVTPLIGDPQHPSHVDVPIKVNIESLGYELFFKHEKYDDVIMAFKKIAAGGLLIVAKEITEPDRTKDELWEFLRHCRNAAAHGGSFNFQNGEPKLPILSLGWFSTLKYTVFGHKRELLITIVSQLFRGNSRGFNRSRRSVTDYPNVNFCFPSSGINVLSVPMYVAATLMLNFSKANP